MERDVRHIFVAVEVTCAGFYEVDGGSYNISCSTNVLPTTTDCSLNGRPHPCDPGIVNTQPRTSVVSISQ